MERWNSEKEIVGQRGGRSENWREDELVRWNGRGAEEGVFREAVMVELEAGEETEERGPGENGGREGERGEEVAGGKEVMGGSVEMEELGGVERREQAVRKEVLVELGNLAGG